jgi:hypothetical protein
MPDPAKTSANAALVFAAGKGHLEGAQEALTQGADINKPDTNKETPLMAAAREGRAKMVRFLLRHGADPNRRVGVSLGASGAEECSALHSAIRFGKKLEVVKALVEGGADPTVTFYGDTMIVVAAEAGQLEILQYLVEKGVDPHAVNEDSGTTALDKARSCKQKEIIDWLKSMGVVSKRESGRILSRVLAREFGGKPIEHTRGFLTNSKFHGYKAQFHVESQDAGVGVFGLKFLDEPLRAMNGNLFFAAKQPKVHRTNLRQVKRLGENLGIKVWRVGDTKAVSDQFIAEFLNTHDAIFRAFNFSEPEQLRIGQNSMALIWEGLDLAKVTERLRLLNKLMSEVCRAPKPERRLFESEWVLKPFSKRAGTTRAAEHQFGGNLPTRVACATCGGHTNLMAQIDLSDSILPKTVFGAKRLPLFWCLTCLEWDPAFYDISADIPKPLSAQGEPIPQKKVIDEGEEDLPTRAATLVTIPAGKKAGQKTKLGGKPTWIQSDGTPDCPKCDTPMAFAAQLASDKHIAYSDMGFLYAFLCPECKILATLIHSH